MQVSRSILKKIPNIHWRANTNINSEKKVACAVDVLNHRCSRRLCRIKNL